MIFNKIYKKDLITVVMKAIDNATMTIDATMLLSEEVEKPLPPKYHELLKKKIKEDVSIKRLGFGTKEDYNKIKQKFNIQSSKFIFKYKTNCKEYQRMIAIDNKYVFFAIDSDFFVSENRYIVKAFINYFYDQFLTEKYE